MTAPARFRSTRFLMGLPRWLTEGESGLVGYSLGLIMDAFAERARLGLLAQFPSRAPADALIKLGRDRRVVRGLSESPEEYATRLGSAFDDRRGAGAPFPMLERLAEYLGPLPRLRIVTNRGSWYTREPNGDISYVLNAGNWNWDNRTDLWSRFWVIIYPNGLWTEGEPNSWGDPGAQNWGENPASTWGTSATPEQVKTVKFIVNDWKPAGSRCKNIIIAFDPTSFSPTAPEPDGTWGNWGKIDVGGRQIPSRLQTARYWDGA